MITFKRLLSLITLLIVPVALYSHVTQINKQITPIVNEMAVEDFALHPIKKTVITYLNKTYVEVFDIKKAQSIVKIRNLDKNSMISCAWLYFDYKINNKTYNKPLAIGFESGKLLLLHIDFDNKNYEVVERFIFKQPISHIEAKPSTKNFGNRFWAATEGYTNKFNTKASTRFFIKNRPAHEVTLNNAIFWSPALPERSDITLSTLAWRQNPNNQITTTINGFFEYKKSSIRLLGAYRGLDLYPQKTDLIVTGKHDAGKNERAQVSTYNIKTGKFISSFPVHVPGVGINDLSFNKNDPNILAIGYGGYVDIWDVTPGTKPHRVGYVQPQPMTVKKVFWWKINNQRTWFFVLYEEGDLLGWEIEHASTLHLVIRLKELSI